MTEETIRAEVNAAITDALEVLRKSFHQLSAKAASKTERALVVLGFIEASGIMAISILGGILGNVPDAVLVGIATRTVEEMGRRLKEHPPAPNNANKSEKLAELLSKIAPLAPTP